MPQIKAATGTPRSDGATSTWAQAQALLAHLPKLVSSRVHLLALELCRAGGALAWIAAVGIVAALTMATAWLALCAAAAAALTEHGLDWGWSVLIVALFNFGGAGVALLKLRSLLRLLTLPGTSRRLGVVGATAAAAREAAAGASPPVSTPTNSR